LITNGLQNILSTLVDEGDLLVSLGLTKPNVEGGNYQVKVFDNPIKS